LKTTFWSAANCGIYEGTQVRQGRGFWGAGVILTRANSGV